MLVLHHQQHITSMQLDKAFVYYTANCFEIIVLYPALNYISRLPGYIVHYRGVPLHCMLLENQVMINVKFLTPQDLAVPNGIQ